jgi:hypothetical protein
MPRLPAKQREAEKVATKLQNGSYAAAVNDSPARVSWDVSILFQSCISTSLMVVTQSILTCIITFAGTCHQVSPKNERRSS